MKKEKNKKKERAPINVIVGRIDAILIATNYLDDEISPRKRVNLFHSVSQGKRRTSRRGDSLMIQVQNREIPRKFFISGSTVDPRGSALAGIEIVSRAREMARSHLHGKGE